MTPRPLTVSQQHRSAAAPLRTEPGNNRINILKLLADVQEFVNRAALKIKVQK